MVGCTSNVQQLPPLPGIPPEGSIASLPQFPQLVTRQKINAVETQVPEPEYESIQLAPEQITARPQLSAMASAQLQKPVDSVQTNSSQPALLPPLAQVTLVEVQVTEVVQPPTRGDSGLSTIPTLNETGATVQPEEKIGDLLLEFVASDLVKALAFVPGLSPSVTSFNTSGTGSAFTRAVESSIQQAGYSFNDDSTTANTLLLTTALRQNVRASGSRELSAFLSIDDTHIGRKYVVLNDDVKPATSYFVRGIDPALVDTSGPVIIR